MKRGGVLFDPKAGKEVGNIWEIQLRSLPVTYSCKNISDPDCTFYVAFLNQGCLLNPNGSKLLSDMDGVQIRCWNFLTIYGG